MSKVNLTSIANLDGNPGSAETNINANFAALQAQIDLLLSRDGTAPNTMEHDLDMNSNNIINVGSITEGTPPVATEVFAGTDFQTTPSIFGGFSNIVEYGGLRFRRSGFTVDSGGNPVGYGNFTAAYFLSGQGSGTAASVTPSSPNIAPIIPGRKQTATAAINNGAETHYGTLSGYYRKRSGIAKKAGFIITGRVSFETIRSDQRLSVGLAWTILNPSPNSDPNFNVNVIQFAKDQADTNLQLMHNDSAGLCTKVDLGVVATTLAGKLLEFFFIVDPEDEDRIHYRLQNLDSGTIYEGSVTTNLIEVDVPLKLLVNANTGNATATAVSHTFYNVDFITQY